MAIQSYSASDAPAFNPPAALDSTYRRITLRLLPFLMVLWVLSWIDRVNIGFAKLQMLADLKFSETVYGIGAGIFFIGYFICEVPSNLLLDRIGARKTIARITFLWGICCMAMMFVTTPAIFYVLRFLLGRLRGRLLSRRDPVPDVLVPDRTAGARCSACSCRPRRSPASSAARSRAAS